MLKEYLLDHHNVTHYTCKATTANILAINLGTRKHCTQEQVTEESVSVPRAHLVARS